MHPCLNKIDDTQPVSGLLGDLELDRLVLGLDVVLPDIPRTGPGVDPAAVPPSAVQLLLAAPLDAPVHQATSGRAMELTYRIGTGRSEQTPLPSRTISSHRAQSLKGGVRSEQSQSVIISTE